MILTPYLNLSGDAEQVMQYYQSIFGGDIEIMRWKEMPPNDKMPVDEDMKEKVMHGTLTIKDDVKIFFADSWMDQKIQKPNNIFLHIEFDSEADLTNVFKVLAKDGSVNMPLGKQFWGDMYGDLVDKNGIGWGLHYHAEE